MPALFYVPHEDPAFDNAVSYLPADMVPKPPKRAGVAFQVSKTKMGGMFKIHNTFTLLFLAVAHADRGPAARRRRQAKVGRQRRRSKQRRHARRRRRRRVARDARVVVLVLRSACLAAAAREADEVAYSLRDGFFGILIRKRILSFIREYALLLWVEGLLTRHFMDLLYSRLTRL